MSKAQVLDGNVCLNKKKNRTVSSTHKVCTGLEECVCALWSHTGSLLSTLAWLQLKEFYSDTPRPTQYSLCSSGCNIPYFFLFLR